MGKDRLYRRPNGRWYMDLRDLGAGRITTGERDRDKALQVLGRKLAELQDPRAEAEAEEYRGGVTLEAYAAHHLEAKALNRRPRTVQRDRHSLSVFLEWARGRLKKKTILLSDVSTKLLNQYSRDRQGEGMAPQTVLHELHALSNLYKRAISEGLAERNPVRDMVDKPRIERDEPVWLEVEEAARFLLACSGDLKGLMAVGLLTGGRKSEVTGLQTEEVDFQRSLVRFRPNRWRPLKAGRARSVPLWPQLREILGEFQLTPGLLFPNGGGQPYGDVRKRIAEAAKRAGVAKHISWNTLRHTYASVRLQTLDNGAPVSPFTVARELGHKSLTMIFRHYGHILQSPQRLEVVEYKTEDQRILDALMGKDRPRATHEPIEIEKYRGQNGA